jgi:hypothetical protein
MQITAMSDEERNAHTAVCVGRGFSAEKSSG